MGTRPRKDFSMKIPLPTSIRGLVTLIVLFSLLPALGIIALAGYDKVQSEFESVSTSAGRMVSVIMHRQALRLESARTLLQTLARLRGVRELDADACAGLFADILHDSPMYMDIRLCDREGNILASGTAAQTGPLPFPGSLRDIPPGFSVSVLPRLAEQAAPLLLCRQIVERNGRPVAVLETAIPLTLLPAEENTIRVKYLDHVHISDAEGTVILSYPLPDCAGTNEREYRDDAWERIVASRGNRGILRDSPGERVLYEKLTPGSGAIPALTMVLTISTQSVYAGLRGIIGVNILLLAIVPLVALVITPQIASYSLIRPARALLNAARRISQGDLSTRLGRDDMPEELRLLADSLDAMAASLESRDSELVTARDAADRGNQAKTDFLANMSHEIRTPMNAILGMTYLSRQGELTDRQRVYLDAIHKEAGHLLLLINDILDFSKIEAGKFHIELVPFHLPRLLDEVLKTTLEQARRKGVFPDVRLAPDLPVWLRGDPVHFSQALGNMLGAAVTFSTSAAPSFSCAVERASSPRTTLVCSMRFTTGPEEFALLKRLLLAPAEDTDQETAPSALEDSHGLNLALTRKLVGLMRGDVLATDMETGEKEIVLRLPFTEIRQLSPEDETDPAVAGGGEGVSPSAALPDAEDEQSDTLAGNLNGIRILLVEDNPINQQIAEEILTELGGTVAIAPNGLQALIMLENAPTAYPFHVVLMDLQMPELDGLSAVRRIRLDDRFKSLPVIAMTAYSREEEWEACREAGMDDIIGKPFAVPELLTTVRLWAASKRNVL